MATVSLQTVFDDARRAIETGAADKAIGIAQHILVHFPRMIEGSRLLGEACLNAGQPEQAAAAFSQVLQADPENVAAYYGRGLALQSLEQHPAAITSFERALEIQPNLADLRTQLMRLYSEMPGSSAQFRLSRAGLGRLYARGGMFSQAIDEFRAVLDAEPERDDVKVALAEALWRDGQEDEAMDYCRDLLEQQPDLLKPTVLLGYMLFAAGQPEGEALWRRAAAQDATMALSRTLFDILPPIRIEEPVVPEFNEAEWRAQQARRAAQSEAATAVPVVNEAEEDFFADSWLSSTGTAAAASSAAQIYDAPPVAAPAAAQVVGDTNDDDLLASLLGFGSDEPAAQPSASATPPSDVQPFSFDDWDTPAGDNQRNQSAALPRSLNDFALADDRPGAQPNTDIADVKPFSFDDWSFDDEDERPTSPTAPTTSKLDDDLDLGNIAAFSLDEPESPSAAAPTDTGGVGNVQPFSLDFDDEPESPSAAVPADTHAVGNVQPFNLDFDDEAEPAGGLQPFSLEDDPNSADAVKPFSFDDDDLDVAPFSFDDEERGPAVSSASEAEAGLGAVQPFSLDEWAMDDAAAPAAGLQPPRNTNQSIAGEQADDLGDFKPFSLDELALDSLDDDSAGTLSGPRLADAEERTPEPTTFNWEEPTWRAAITPGSEGDAQSDESIFAKLMRTRPPAVQPSAQPPVADEESLGEDDQFFSLDDESLRLDLDGIDQNVPTSDFDDPVSEVKQSALAPQAQSSAEAQAASADTGHDAVDASSALPFSLDELTADGENFSWEAPQPIAEPANEELVPFSLSELGLSDDELAAFDAQPELDAAAVSEPAPFSLAELGLSDDEIAALDLDDEPRTAQDSAANIAERDVQPQGELFTADPAPPASAAATNAEPESLPFSMADLGLTDDEIALLNEEPGYDEGTGVASETQQEDFAALLGDLNEREEPALSSDGDAAAESSDAEWLDFQSELDVDLPATRTPDDFLMEAQEADGDVQSVLETMPFESVGDDTSETMPFSLSELGLDDLELLEQAPADQPISDLPYPAPDDAAPALPFAEASSPQGLFATEDQGSLFEQADSTGTFAVDDVGEQHFGRWLDTQSDSTLEHDSSPIVSEVVSGASSGVNMGDALSYHAVAGEAGESSGDTPAFPLPADLPEGAQPLAAAADTPAVDTVGSPQSVSQPSGDYGTGIATIHAQLAAEPENDAMRLAVARMSQSINDPAQAFEQYRLLIKRGRLLDEVIVDLQDTIAENDDPQMLRRLHRLLGDAYMKQNRIREAMDEYSWTLPASS